MAKLKKTPAELYEHWPRRTVVHRNVQHERVRLFVYNVADLLRTESRFESINALAKHCDVGSSTLADILAGRAWPTALTIAALEVGTGQALWPRLDGLETPRSSEDAELLEELMRNADEVSGLSREM